jgi:hypothetical protein
VEENHEKPKHGIIERPTRMPMMAFRQQRRGIRVVVPCPMNEPRWAGFCIAIPVQCPWKRVLKETKESSNHDPASYPTKETPKRASIGRDKGKKSY